MNYAEIRKLCYDYGAHNIGGWIEDPDKEWLSEGLSSLKFDYDPVMAEIGVFQGGGSLIFLTAILNLKHYAVDDWKGGPVSPGFPTIKEAFQAFTKPFENRITLVGGDSITIGEKWDIPLDICFVDACHEGEYPKLDILNFGKWVKVGGYLLVDDLKMVDVEKAVKSELTNNPKWALVRYPKEGEGDIAVFQKVE